MSKEMEEQILKLSIVKNPAALESYFYLSLLKGSDFLIERVKIIKEDYLSYIPIDAIRYFVERDKLSSLHKKVFKEQIIFDPKALLFGFKNRPDEMPKELIREYNFTEDSIRDFRNRNDPKSRIEKLKLLIGADPNPKNTTVIIMAKSISEINTPLLEYYKRSIVCCSHEASDKSFGEIEVFENYMVYFGSDDYFERLENALEIIETDFIFLIGSDDFVFNNFLTSGEMLLEKNAALAAVCGIGSDVATNKIKDIPLFAAIRMTDNPIIIADPTQRIKEWALFGGVTLNSLIRKKQLKDILMYLPKISSPMVKEYYIDISLVLSGPSFRINDLSIVRMRNSESGTYTIPPPIIEMTMSDTNMLRPIVESISRFAQAAKISIKEEIINWVVAYGSSRRFLENGAHHHGITTLPKTLQSNNKQHYFGVSSQKTYTILAFIISILLNEKK